MAAKRPPERIVSIDDRSLHLEDVKILWRANSDTLGFLPEGAFEDYARERHILVALNPEEKCVGYLLYRVVRDKATIAHLCVAKGVRGSGYAAALVGHLMSITEHLRGIGLRCRRDFPAYNLWQHLGFVAIGEVTGRGKQGEPVTQFWLDYNKPDLLSQEVTTALVAAIDMNVFLDLMESSNEESMGLQADWLQESLTLAVTEESYNEIDRSEDLNLRKKRKADLAAFAVLRCSPEERQKAEQLLAPLFPDLSTPQDKSDFQQLVRALAAGADVFVTRDDELLLKRSDDVYDACGLSVLRPAEVIGRIDELLREHEYQRSLVAGTNRLSRQRINVVDDALLETIRYPHEPKRSLRRELIRFLADPMRFSCMTIKDKADGLLAFYVVEQAGKLDRVSVLRICAHRLAGTLARSILTELAYNAVQNGQSAIVVDKSCANGDIQTALADQGFLLTEDGWIKIVMKGLLPVRDLVDQVDQLKVPPHSIAQLLSLLHSPLDPSTASQLEHVLSPCKIADAEIPSFIVPIQPDYALDLFDEILARQRLYGAEAELALNPESVYYRSAWHRILQSPGRILWYVSKNDKFHGTMAIRACSRIAEVCIGKPKSMFKRFRRLGVYEWSDLVKTVRGNIEKEIMAVRFHDTELLEPVTWGAFQAILRRHGTKTNLESPVRVSREEFNEIYTLGLGSSAFR